MTEADNVIAALRTVHDSLVEFVTPLSDDDLTHASGASEWDVSGVLSHLGSGAVINRATLAAMLAGEPNPGREFNQSVWNEWNAKSPRQRVDDFIAADAALVEAYEALDVDQRESLRIDVGFLPAPIDVATAARMRLNEQALHSWDARVGFDASATIAPEATALLLGGSGDLLGFIAKTDQLGGRQLVIEVTTAEPSAVFALNLAERVTIDFDYAADSDAQSSVDATLTLPAEAWLRLSTGRLDADHTPAGVTTTGAADLDLLRGVFQGY
ncbi:maleylpyruvate isomerase N-terminal domain-containing protein [Subtercola lobariae]|uniref:Mycothiol-dependent maleylpyruvate isomerase metal-binding domain-containing protein n=1 Tax=Subtercola lobariae TaxID=1588641 RepID=A0A917F009_9MICO|nr:maleylpyruvate isomerase N-terminal domain-containing protein [Subtercola lobariae]GGF31080.1 hypothetical protein GCM10011399_25370 [Subtercola lobariae]